MIPDCDSGSIGIAVTPFDRTFRAGTGTIAAIGTGSIGGKAHGLALMSDTIARKVRPHFVPDTVVNIPTLAVIATDFFDTFMEENGLHAVAFSDERDDVIAHAFQQATLPVRMLGDLRALITQVHEPLAIRSSSLLEDAMYRPFAGVYGTKMIPNNQPDSDARFLKLAEAIKYVYASTYFRAAKQYVGATDRSSRDEKMAVIIQEVVGTKCGERFYPQISGVARSYNYYPIGNADGGDGIVELALGLGRSIVDDGVGWAYCPEYPNASPPYNSLEELLDRGQQRFWAVNMGTPPEYDPIKETEYLKQFQLAEAEYDGALDHIASTFNARDETIVMGIRERGARLLDFAPILKTNYVELNDLLKMLLAVCKERFRCEVEIEFAVTLESEERLRARFGFLQVRPMVVSDQVVEIPPHALLEETVLVGSEMVLGNGTINSIRDIVFVKPETFAPEVTSQIALELEGINRSLDAAGRPYLLIGFGRWGTSDPWAGIPVTFGQISGARVIVECTIPGMDFSLSQGSHFFHNVTSFEIPYFSVRHTDPRGVDWGWLNNQPVVEQTKHVSHCQLDAPLDVLVDGRQRRGVVRHG